MRRLLIVLALMLPATAGAQVVTEMTPERIREAIAAKNGDTCYVLPHSGLRSVNILACFTTPYSRVFRAARDAKEAYKPFAEKNATPQMIAPELRIHTLAQANELAVAKVVAVVVTPVKSTDRSAAIQPLRTEETADSGITIAIFPINVLRADNEVRVVYDAEVCTEGGRKESKECRARFNLAGVR